MVQYGLTSRTNLKSPTVLQVWACLCVSSTLPSQMGRWSITRVVSCNVARETCDSRGLFQPALWSDISGGSLSKYRHSQ